MAHCWPARFVSRKKSSAATPQSTDAEEGCEVETRQRPQRVAIDQLDLAEGRSLFPCPLLFQRGTYAGGNNVSHLLCLAQMLFVIQEKHRLTLKVSRRPAQVIDTRTKL